VATGQLPQKADTPLVTEATVAAEAAIKVDDLCGGREV